MEGGGAGRAGGWVVVHMGQALPPSAWSLCEWRLPSFYLCSLPSQGQAATQLPPRGPEPRLDRSATGTEGQSVQSQSRSWEQLQLEEQKGQPALRVHQAAVAAAPPAAQPLGRSQRHAAPAMEESGTLRCNGCWSACDSSQRSVATACQHLYCLSCCQTILESDDPTCPICSQVSAARRPPALLPPL